MTAKKEIQKNEEQKVKQLTKIINEFFTLKGYKQVGCMIEFNMVPAKNPLRRMLAPVGLINKLKTLKQNPRGAFDIIPGYLAPIEIRCAFPIDYLFFQHKEYDKRKDVAHEFAQYYKEKTGFDARIR